MVQLPKPSDRWPETWKVIVGLELLGENTPTSTLRHMKGPYTHTHTNKCNLFFSLKDERYKREFFLCARQTLPYPWLVCVTPFLALPVITVHNCSATRCRNDHNTVMFL